MPKAIISGGNGRITEYLRPDHDESGVIHVRSKFDDCGVHEKNKRARLDGTLKTGDKLNVHDNAEIVYHFQIPSAALWSDFKKRHPDIATGIRSSIQAIREKAAADLRKLRPHWVVAAPGKHHW